MTSRDRDAFGFPIPQDRLAPNDPLLQPTVGKAGRDEFRKREIEKRLQRAGPVPADERPILWLMAGGSGSGKSTILKKLQKKGEVARQNVVHLDPDDFKKDIPEFNELVKRKDSRAAEVVHEESGLMAREAFRQAIAQRSDIIYDSTLSNFGKAFDIIMQARENDYEIRIIGVTVAPRTAVTRVRERGDKTGRYVPVKDLLTTHKNFTKWFVEYVGLADSVELWKTDCVDGNMVEKIADAVEGRLDVLLESEYAEFSASANLNENATTPDEI
jgi:predicted ABC-type ATPase